MVIIVNKETRKKKLTRKEKRAEKKKKKNLEKKDKDFNGDKGFTYPFGYSETDAYVFPNKHTAISIFDVTFQYGTNSPAEIGWLTNNLIPNENISDGKIYFIERQALMSKEVESKIKDKYINKQRDMITNNKSNSGREEAKDAGRVFDLDMAAALSGEEDKIVDGDVLLIVKANTAEQIENIIDELKTSYKDNQVRGVMITRITGELLKVMAQLFVKTSADTWHSTEMGAVAAGKLFLPSSGFSDPRGQYVGTDIRSLLANNPSVIDFSTIKDAVIFMGDVSPYISIGSRSVGHLVYDGGSAVATVVAKGAYYRGERTHHIMLSKFDYHLPDSRIFDMSKEAINPIEVFGTPETVIKDANANFSKATKMMLYASQTEDNPYVASRLKSMLVDWMTNNAGGTGMYTNRPLKEKTRAQRILATEDHETYPTPKDFFMMLTIDKARAKREGEQTAREATHMATTMSSLADTYPNIFNSTTTLPDVFKANERNIYYELGGISEDKRIIGIQFLNVLAYVTNRALPGEQIVIHGLDQMNLPVDAFLDYKERIIRKNLGLITVFEHSQNDVNPVTFEKFCGRLSQQDMVVLGGAKKEELEEFSDSWQQTIPASVASQLVEGTSGVLYFYRSLDNVGALIDTHLVL